MARATETEEVAAVDAVAAVEPAGESRRAVTVAMAEARRVVAAVTMEADEKAVAAREAGQKAEGRQAVVALVEVRLVAAWVER